MVDQTEVDWKSRYYQQVELATNYRDQWRKDVDTIGAALLEEAEERNWCNLFDQFVERLNEKLLVELPVRKKTFVITETYLVTRTIEVAASDADEALDEVDQVNWVDDLDKNGWDVTDVSVKTREIEEQ